MNANQQSVLSVVQRIDGVRRAELETFLAEQA
jgi:hypothetical protein